jgi:hypothetical protein
MKSQFLSLICEYLKAKTTQGQDKIFGDSREPIYPDKFYMLSLIHIKEANKLFGLDRQGKQTPINKKFKLLEKEKVPFHLVDNNDYFEKLMGPETITPQQADHGDYGVPPSENITPAPSNAYGNQLQTDLISKIDNFSNGIDRQRDSMVQNFQNHPKFSPSSLPKFQELKENIEAINAIVTDD